MDANADNLILEESEFGFDHIPEKFAALWGRSRGDTSERYL